MSIAFQKSNGDGSKMQELIDKVGKPFIGLEAFDLYSFSSPHRYSRSYSTVFSDELDECYGRHNFSFHFQESNGQNAIVEVILFLGGLPVYKNVVAMVGNSVASRDFELIGKFDEIEVRSSSALSVCQTYINFNGYKAPPLPIFNWTLNYKNEQFEPFAEMRIIHGNSHDVVMNFNESGSEAVAYTNNDFFVITNLTANTALLIGYELKVGGIENKSAEHGQSIVIQMSTLMPGTTGDLMVVNLPEP